MRLRPCHGVAGLSRARYASWRYPEKNARPRFSQLCTTFAQRTTLEHSTLAVPLPSSHPSAAWSALRVSCCFHAWNGKEAAGRRSRRHPAQPSPASIASRDVGQAGTRALTDEASGLDSQLLGTKSKFPHTPRCLARGSEALRDTMTKTVTPAHVQPRPVIVHAETKLLGT